MKIEKAEKIFEEVLEGYTDHWCVAGGWAIDFFLNKQTREHEDLEIVVFRDDVKTLFNHFKKYQPQKIITGGENPEFVLWDGKEIEEEVIQLRFTLQDNVEFDLLLTPREKGEWVCRRDESIKLPMNQAICHSSSGLPLLAPEIVLLFKAKYVREKDAADFKHTYLLLSAHSKAWLQKHLKSIHPNHEWLD